MCCPRARRGSGRLGSHRRGDDGSNHVSHDGHPIDELRSLSRSLDMPRPVREGREPQEILFRRAGEEAGGGGRMDFIVEPGSWR